MADTLDLLAGYYPFELSHAKALYFVVLIKLSKQPLSYLHKTPFNTEMTAWHFLICTNHMADSFVLQEPIPYGSVV